MKQTEQKKAHKNTREYYNRKILRLLPIIIYTHFHLERDSFAVAQLTFQNTNICKWKMVIFKSKIGAILALGTTKISTQNTKQKYVNY